MPWNSAGAFTRTIGDKSGNDLWQKEASNEATRVLDPKKFDIHDQDLASGIEACLAKNGENSVTADMSLGGMRWKDAGVAKVSDDLIRADQVQKLCDTYADDTGAADAYRLVFVPPVVSIVGGQRFTFKAKNNNTKLSTLTIDGFDPVPIKLNGNDLAAGDIKKDDIVSVMYDSVKKVFTLPSLSALSGTKKTIVAGIRAQSYTAFTTKGSDKAFTVAPDPAIETYTDGQRFRLRFHEAFPADATLNVNDLGAKSVKRYDGAGKKVPLDFGFVVDQRVDVEYDGTDFVVDSGVGTMPRYATGDALPTRNIGAIWHDGYASVMTWQTFNANGASYTGYASVNIGEVVYSSQPSLRAGFIGSAAIISKATYAALYNWAKYNGLWVSSGWVAGTLNYKDSGSSNFVVPDLGGAFIRGWRSGQSYDSGRGFGTLQGDAFKSHRHSLTQSNSNQWGSPRTYLFPHASNNIASDWRHNTNATGGNETRPINTAFRVIIKY